MHLRRHSLRNLRRVMPSRIEEILRDVSLDPSSAVNICTQLDDGPIRPGPKIRGYHHGHHGQGGIVKNYGGNVI